MKGEGHWEALKVSVLCLLIKNHFLPWDKNIEGLLLQYGGDTHPGETYKPDTILNE